MALRYVPTGRAEDDADDSVQSSALPACAGHFSLSFVVLFVWANFVYMLSDPSSLEGA